MISISIPVLLAQAALAAATNVVYESATVTNRAWRRHEVSEMHGEDGSVRLMDRRRVLVSKADEVAEAAATEQSYRVAKAFAEGFAQGTNLLADAMNAAVTNATYTEWQIVETGSDMVEVGTPGDGADTSHVFVSPVLWAYGGGNLWTLTYDYWAYGGGWQCYPDMAMHFAGGADALSMTDSDAGGVVRAERTRGPDEVISGPPTNGVMLKLVFPLAPLAMLRRDGGIFVVSNAYDAAQNRDELYVFFNADPPMKPIIRAPYVHGSGSVTNWAVGRFTVGDVPDSHWTNAVDVTRFGRTYAKCRRCWFDRPEALRGEAVMLNRHVRFGGADGIEWGSIAVKVLGRMSFTGEVTNAAEGVVATFSNGAYMSTRPLDAGEGAEE